MKKLSLLAALAFFPAIAFAQSENTATKDASPEQEVGSDAVTVERTQAPAVPAGEAPDLPPGTVHTVSEGDTLWDLSERYMGSPWYWPKVWSYNPEIDNPHMIYPGSKIRFNAPANDGATSEMPSRVSVGNNEKTPPLSNKAEAIPGLEEDDDDEDREFMEDELVTVSEGKTIGMASVVDNGGMIAQTTFLPAEDFKAAGKIESAFSEKRMLSIFDKVYVTFEDEDNVHIGDRFTIFRSGNEIVNPETGDSCGYQIDAIGTLRIVSLNPELKEKREKKKKEKEAEEAQNGKAADNSSEKKDGEQEEERTRITAIIESATDEIRRGDMVSSLSEFDKKLEPKEHEGDEDIRGHILAAQNPILPLFGEQHVVFIDRGANDGVKIGNVFEVIRTGDPSTTRTEANEDDAYPEEVVGTIQVIDLGESTSIGIITKAIFEISLGETVVIRTHPKN